MRIAMVSIEGISTYGQSKYIESPRKEKETAADWERRCWRERMHVNENGYVFIPPMAFKKSITRAAQMNPMQIPGRGKATYTKHFLAGILVLEPLMLPHKAMDVSGQWLFIPANARSSDRVWKCFPYINDWGGDVIFHVLDDTITPPVFKRHIVEAGEFVGLGFFRPERGGYWGRFKVKNIEWEEKEAIYDEE